jgi:hypothetical protein
MHRYLELIADEAGRDMDVFHTTWVYVTVFPLILYTTYCMVKWYVLLMPVTLPMTIWLASKTTKSDVHCRNRNN